MLWYELVQSPNSTSCVFCQLSYSDFPEARQGRRTIHNNGNFLAMLGCQNVVQERRLPGSKVSYPHLGMSTLNNLSRSACVRRRHGKKGTEGVHGLPVTIVMGTFTLGPPSSLIVPTSSVASTRSGGVSSSKSIRWFLLPIPSGDRWMG
jgi:hypothetical protein